jgi:molybdopterin molybdotransferase
VAAALLSVEDALARVLANVEPLPLEYVPLMQAHGRVLATELAALRTQPPADVSAMDGYAVRAADVAIVPARLKLVGEVAAGRPFDHAVGEGETARIFTGGVLPDGADTVVIQEVTARENDIVVVRKPAVAGANVRPAGLDFKAGDVLLMAQHRLTARDLALAAGMNHASVPVRRPPKLALFSTGDELVVPGTVPGRGQIVCSNGFALTALAESEGAEIIDLGIVPDRLEETIAAVRRARDLSADILVTTGGASVGDYDLVQRAFAAEGMELSFWKVALRPGRPLMHGLLPPMHVLGLPGNPVSAYVCALLFLVPLIRRLAGRADVKLTPDSALLGRDLPANDERADYMRANLRVDDRGCFVVDPIVIQDSSMMRVLAKADCLLIREPYAPAAKAGERCAVLKLGF